MGESLKEHNEGEGAIFLSLDSDCRNMHAWGRLKIAELKIHKLYRDFSFYPRDRFCSLSLTKLFLGK